MWCPKYTFSRCTRIFFLAFVRGFVIGQVVFLFGSNKHHVCICKCDSYLPQLLTFEIGLSLDMSY